MRINEQTKIAKLLKQHPDALETIITLSPDFKKLRNPILRKLMAGRTSIAMASKIGGCTPEQFFKALQPLGFEYDTAAAPHAEEAFQQQPIPEFLKSLEAAQLITFDVRQMLSEGNDPLKDIQQKIKELKQGQVLNIINTFEPVPLIKLLEKQGFEVFVNQLEPTYYETFFYKKDSNSRADFTTDTGTADDWDEILVQFDGNMQEVDVRAMEMPMPMMTILGALKDLPEDKILYVHHKKIPIFLLTELKDRGFDYRIKDVKEGEVFLLIFKKQS
ncbi:MAG TPA: DUF2249 domain-containing protein [Flavobacterium sp.]|nr:DUF2249 domain-containing protein [Flavobacterium sp.]